MKCLKDDKKIVTIDMSKDFHQISCEICNNSSFFIYDFGENSRLFMCNKCGNFIFIKRAVNF
jgi:ribosomal protein S27E